MNFDKNSKNGRLENSNFLLQKKSNRKINPKDMEISILEKSKKTRNSSSKSKKFKNDMVNIMDSNYNNSNNLYSLKIKTKTYTPLKKLRPKSNYFYLCYNFFYIFFYFC